MNVSSRIKAVIFDFDGTLVSETHWIESRWKKTIIYAEKELKLKNFGKVFWKIFREKGHKYKNHVNDTIEKLDYDLNNLRKIVDKFLSKVVDEELMDGVIECLDFLKNKYKLGIITNGTKEVQSKRIMNAGIFDYFDIIIYAFENPKPSRNPYEECLSFLKVKPRETIFIGDDFINDFQTPRELGMISVYFNPRKDKYFFESEYIVKSFNELLNLFKEIN